MVANALFAATGLTLALFFFFGKQAAFDSLSPPARSPVRNSDFGLQIAVLFVNPRGNFSPSGAGSS